MREALAAAKSRLRRAGVEEPDLGAELLLARCLGIDRTGLFREGGRSLPDGVRAVFEALLGRREAHVPIAYLLGEQEFMGLTFEVDPHVLIPRPETEFLVEKALECLEAAGEKPLVVDVGTGSGCVAVALAKRDPRVRVLGVDRSLEALKVGRRNAAKHGVAERARWIQGDCLRGLGARRLADMVISNPPYIDPAEKGSLSPGVRDYEPPAALFTPRGDPTFFHRRIAQEAAHRIKPGGFLLLECGVGQAGSLVGEIRTRGYEPVRVYRDYSGIERVLLAQCLG